jgi:hypothetical protein
MELMLKEFKTSTIRKVEKLRQEMVDGFNKNDCEKLEVKIVDRMNDATVALTKELADRIDTRKNFRLIERQLRNIFNMALQGLKVTGQISHETIFKASKFMLYQQTEIIAAHLSVFDFNSGQDADLFVKGEDIMKLSANKRMHASLN